jgi:hypothetical protein
MSFGDEISRISSQNYTDFRCPRKGLGNIAVAWRRILAACRLGNEGRLAFTEHGREDDLVGGPREAVASEGRGQE